MKSFIVEIWRIVFLWLLRITPYGLLSLRFKFSHGGVDAWVLGHFLLALLGWLFLPINNCVVIGKIVGCYAAWRIVEIVVYQINVILFDPFPTSNDALLSYRRSVLLAMQTFLEVFFWFAAIYKIFADRFEHADILRNLDGSLYFSAVTMATVGYGDITPLRTSTLGHLIVVSHIGVGFFLTVVVIARFISLLPKPKTMTDD